MAPLFTADERRSQLQQLMCRERRARYPNALVIVLPRGPSIYVYTSSEIT